MIRLRQVVLAAFDLESVVERICSRYDLEVCFNDQSVAEFGLRNALIDVGDQLIEVVSPITTNTAAGRLLDKRCTDVAGYMVMFEIDDLEQRESALRAAGVRIVWSGDLPSISGRHLHPGDVGGAIVSIDETRPQGSWHWAGPDWVAHRHTTVVAAVAGMTIATTDPSATRQRWTELGLGASIGFAEQSSIDLVANDRSRAGESCTLGAVTLRLV